MLRRHRVLALFCGPLFCRGLLAGVADNPRALPDRGPPLTGNYTHPMFFLPRILSYPCESS